MINYHTIVWISTQNTHRIISVSRTFNDYKTIDTWLSPQMNVHNFIFDIVKLLDL
jgi:hypothetical protein